MYVRSLLQIASRRSLPLIRSTVASAQHRVATTSSSSSSVRHFYTAKSKPHEYRSGDTERVLSENIKSGDRLYLHMAAATPQRLCDGLGSLVGKVKNVEVCHMHIEGKLSHIPSKANTPAETAQILESFTDVSMFMGRNVRDAVNAGHAQYIPIFFSEVPHLFRRNVMPLDVALISTSVPDSHGWMSLGPSVDCSLAAVQTAKKVICQVNKYMYVCTSHSRKA
jgi:acyl-CoA hydrolase